MRGRIALQKLSRKVIRVFLFRAERFWECDESSRRFGSSIAALCERRNMATSESSAVADPLQGLDQLNFKNYVDRRLETKSAIDLRTL
jgi:hypothetical protein